MADGGLPGPLGAGRGPGRGAAGPRWAGGEAAPADGASENGTAAGPAAGSWAGAWVTSAGPAAPADAAAARDAAAAPSAAAASTGPAGAFRAPFCPSAAAGAAAFLACTCFGASAENASLSLRTTGASIVEDADRTNSPISWSLAITALLSTPNSFASSYTRTFATALPYSVRLIRTLVAPARAARAPAGVRLCCSSPRSHQALITIGSCFPGNAVLVAALAGRPGQSCPGRHAPLRQILSERAGGQRSRQAQRAGKRPPPPRLLEAFLAEMQVSAPARQPRLGIGDKFAAPGHHAQQIGLGSAGPASDARPDRRYGRGRPQGPHNHSGRKLTAPGHR